jgi:hypothetical protein
MKWINIREEKVRLTKENPFYDVYGYDPHNHSYRITNVRAEDIIRGNIENGEFTVTHWREIKDDYPEDYNGVERKDYNKI